MVAMTAGRKPFYAVTGTVAVAVPLPICAVGWYARLASATGRTMWAEVPIPSGPSGFAGLDQVSCSSSSWCIALDSYLGLSNTSGTAIESWNRTASTLTLIESWNGTSWALASSPNPGTSNTLNSVSCASPNACQAVGYSGKPEEAALIETWNGASWSVAPDPVDALLLGVSCASPDACAAVGGYFTEREERTLAGSWNGTSWSVNTSANSPTTRPETNFECLQAASCDLAGACTAVGQSAVAADLTLAEVAQLPAITSFIGHGRPGRSVLCRRRLKNDPLSAGGSARR